VITYPSRLFEQAVNELARLPGIGRKTALRLILHILRQDAMHAEALGGAIIRLRNEIKYCQRCFNISDNDICDICAESKRDHATVCVVEDVRDVMAIENTRQFQGVYHILGGIISPMDGVRAEDLNVAALHERIQHGGINELILALPATIEGDTTGFYLYKKFIEFPVQVSMIARGISFGDDLEYADEVTLGRSIINRTPYQNSMVK
jgi:recombination protein RecR